MSPNEEEGIDQFSGHELDEALEAGDGKFSEGEDLNAIQKKDKGNKTLFIFMTGLCLLAIFGGIYLYITVSTRHSSEKEDRQTVRLPVQTDQSLYFDSFIIPTEEIGEFTYISFSLTLKMTNRVLEKERVKRKNQLRGIIYDNLRNKIDEEKVVPTIEQIKRFITGTVNGALSTELVDDAYVTDFLAV